jgi:hypothetical protein
MNWKSCIWPHSGARGRPLCISALALALALIVSALSGCRPSRAIQNPERLPEAVQFTDVTERAGIHFTHHNGADGKKLMPETTGSGCAFLDYDNDGWDDILLIDSRTYGPDAPALALYHNNHDGTFTDVTQKAGLTARGYGMGCAIGDYDHDGWDDIYITCLGPNHLYHNNHDGTFTDVTARAGVAGAPVGVNGGLRWKWSSSCAWVDYNNDGKLDLFVCNFVKWSPQNDVFCGRTGGAKQYCSPVAYEGCYNTLYRNNGDGTFTDVSKEVGLTSALGKGWGVVPWDFNGDGWVDFAVANDVSANFLFVNHGGKRFSEEAIKNGIALSDSGSAKAGMGIDVGDWRNDGRFDLLIGNFSNEELSLFDYDSSGSFNNIADQAGMGEPSLHFLTFGLFFCDVDLDGWQDAFIANGHIDDLVHETASNITYAERPLLFHNEQGKRFTEVGLQSGAPFTQPYVLRGCAYGDINNDGFPDFLVVPNNNQPARLWRNEGGNGNHWIRFKLIGVRSNSDGIGAIITVRAGGVTQHQIVKSGGSFLSQSTLRPIFGLGKAVKIDEVEVRWPGGGRETVANPPVDRLAILEEGKGLVHAP